MTSHNPTRVILAIDPGYDRLGWALGQLNGTTLTKLEYGLIQTSKTSDRWQRFNQIERELSQLVTQHQPAELAIETLFFSKNTTTAFQVAETRGLIFSLALRQQMIISEYNPMSVKLAVTGTGKADKQAVEKMVRLQLKLSSEKLIDDTIDALAILLTHTASTKALPNL